MLKCLIKTKRKRFLKALVCWDCDWNCIGFRENRKQDLKKPFQQLQYGVNLYVKQRFTHPEVKVNGHNQSYSLL